MEDAVDVTVDVEGLRHVVLDQLETPRRLQLRDVRAAPGHEVVDGDDLVTARDERLGQVRAEEARTSRDDDAHAQY